jgi:hypothetical protein
MIVKHLRWKLWHEIKLLPWRQARDKFRQNNSALELAIRTSPAMRFLDEQLRYWQDVRKYQDDLRKAENEAFTKAHQNDPLTPREEFINALFRSDVPGVRRALKKIERDEKKKIVRVNGVIQK